MPRRSDATYPCKADSPGGPPATTTSLGSIQLAGDLSGTATAPTVGSAKITAAKLAASAVALNSTTVTGTLPVANGGTGQTAAKAARETGLTAAGYYTTSTHSAGTTISITQATHAL